MQETQNEVSKTLHQRFFNRDEMKKKQPGLQAFMVHAYIWCCLPVARAVNMNMCPCHAGSMEKK